MQKPNPLVLMIAASVAVLAVGCRQHPPTSVNTADAGSSPGYVASVVQPAASGDAASPGNDKLFMISVENTTLGAREPDVVYVPTPPKVVSAMLKAANVRPDDVLYDLGSGDGRIPIAAAQRWGTRGVGVDIDPRRISEARSNAERAHVADKVTFIEGDLFETDLSDATVITLYLLPSLNLQLRPTLLQLEPGTRIVSHAFDMGDWEPERSFTVEGASVHLWTVPEEIPEHLR